MVPYQSHIMMISLSQILSNSNFPLLLYTLGIPVTTFLVSTISISSGFLITSWKWRRRNLLILCPFPLVFQVRSVKNIFMSSYRLLNVRFSAECLVSVKPFEYHLLGVLNSRAVNLYLQAWYDLHPGAIGYRKRDSLETICSVHRGSLAIRRSGVVNNSR